ncbi:membrane protein YdbS with pleckstrin-like domain [Klebsiella sp. BIGb0407]|nr:membrane protein YdbS with pleckstrin-like domain [Klebsiella sp. BIGb0407]
MWSFIRRKVANYPAVKRMSPAQKKRTGGRIILMCTLLIIIQLASLIYSESNVWIHTLSQVVWGVSMVVGLIIAFESDGSGLSK